MWTFRDHKALALSNNWFCVDTAAMRLSPYSHVTTVPLPRKNLPPANDCSEGKVSRHGTSSEKGEMQCRRNGPLSRSHHELHESSWRLYRYSVPQDLSNNIVCASLWAEDPQNLHSQWRLFIEGTPGHIQTDWSVCLHSSRPKGWMWPTHPVSTLILGMEGKN